MSDVSHQNPNFHLSKAPHKQGGVLKNNNKPTKRSTNPKFKCNKMMNNKNNNNPSCFSTTNNKPLKVVHISNPMRYQVTAAEFRALVQGLTGRDAVVDWPDEHFPGVNHQASAHVVVGVGGSSGGGGGASVDVIGDDDDQHQVVQVHQDLHHHEEKTSVTLSACFETSDDLSYDDYFESFHGHVDDVMEDFRAYMVNDHHHH